MLIVVAGTPGTGKTTLATFLRRTLGLKYASLTELVLEFGAWYAYDPVHRSFLIDDSRAAKIVREFVRSNPNAVLEVHDLELLYEAGVEPDVVIVMRCNPKLLYARLMRRQWPITKLIENVEAELIGVTAAQAHTYFENRVCELDSSSLHPTETLRIVIELLKGERSRDVCQRIDWTRDEALVEFVSRLSSGSTEDMELEELLGYVSRALK